MSEAPAPLSPEAAAQMQDELRAATRLFERLVVDRSLLMLLTPDERRRFDAAVADVFHPDPRARRSMVKATARERKLAAAQRADERLEATGIRTLRRKPVFTTPNVYLQGEVEAGTSSVASEDGPEETIAPQHCYICKQKFTAVHHFYDQMCGACADFNYRKRTELVDLTGRTALLTGGRVKIGYQAGLKLLRCGAKLLVTTRFPRDSAMRYAMEPDFAEWRERLVIFGLDLRHTPSVETFCAQLLASEPQLDFIVNNACQTVRRPPAFYAHMMAGELAAANALPPAARRLVERYEDLRASSGQSRLPAATSAAITSPDALALDSLGLTHAAALSQVPLLPEDHDPSQPLFPAGRYDQDLQQVDLRDRNSWRLLLDEVPSIELLEVQLVNAVAPFLLNARLKPLMLRTETRDKHIVNVSAMEGQFYRHNKTTRHPHTNMAKAALNMMTRTSAADYQQSGIHMNSVDTGWVTDEDVVALAERKQERHRFHPPLDIVDGAARIVDPIIDGIATGAHVWGQFLKDYKPTDW